MILLLLIYTTLSLKCYNTQKFSANSILSEFSNFYNLISTITTDHFINIKLKVDALSSVSSDVTGDASLFFRRRLQEVVPSTLYNRSELCGTLAHVAIYSELTYFRTHQKLLNEELRYLADILTISKSISPQICEYQQNLDSLITGNQSTTNLNCSTIDSINEEASLKFTELSNELTTTIQTINRLSSLSIGEQLNKTNTTSFFQLNSSNSVNSKCLGTSMDIIDLTKSSASLSIVNCQLQWMNRTLIPQLSLAISTISHYYLQQYTSLVDLRYASMSASALYLYSEQERYLKGLQYLTEEELALITTLLTFETSDRGELFPCVQDCDSQSGNVYCYGYQQYGSSISTTLACISSLIPSNNLPFFTNNTVDQVVQVTCGTDYCNEFSEDLSLFSHLDINSIFNLCISFSLLPIIALFIATV